MKPLNQGVRVVAPARLHMGFIDLNGTSGRRFGGLGVVLHELETRLSVRTADKLDASGPSANRAIQCVRKFSHLLGVSGDVHVQIDKAIPEHVGLGSGTQMALAIGLGLSQLNGLNLSARKLASICDRGARSGIGIAGFERGGFIVDGGRCTETEIPPVIAHMDFPSQWKIMLVFDSRGKGLHGNHEKEAFKRLLPLPEEKVARVCYLLVMQALPALAESRLRHFGDAVTDIQRSVGNYFAAAQGGRYTSADVGAALDWLGEQGAVGLGQSSWGPTGFCLVVEEQARVLLNAAETRFKDLRTLSFMIATARNQGGEVSLVEPDFDSGLMKKVL